MLYIHIYINLKSNNNALVENIEILQPTHFVFVLKNGMRMDKKI